jgi:hypothetical protein
MYNYMILNVKDQRVIVNYVHLRTFLYWLVLAICGAYMEPMET